VTNVAANSQFGLDVILDGLERLLER